MSLKPLSPSQEKILLMESGGEDLRRLRQMKPLVRYQNHEMSLDSSISRSNGNVSTTPLYSHRRRRHKAYRQSSDISLYEELANSIEEDSPLPELCSINNRYLSSYSRTFKYFNITNLFMYIELTKMLVLMKLRLP